MSKLTTSVTSVGLEFASSTIKGAEVRQTLKGVEIKRLFSVNSEEDHVKPLYTGNSIVSTGLRGSTVLVRSLYFPLVKEKDIASTLAFQAEPLLPYPSEEAILAYQVLGKTSEETTVSLFSARKSGLEEHLNEWRALHIEPEKVSCVPWALCRFASHYVKSAKSFLILHIQDFEMTCSFIREGKLIASYSLQEGAGFVEEIGKAIAPDRLPRTGSEWETFCETGEFSGIGAISRLRSGVIRMGFALAKELKSGESIEGMLITGETSSLTGLDEFLVRPSGFELLRCESLPGVSSDRLLLYALPIGLAIAALPDPANSIEFRQNEYSFPYRWRRIKFPAAIYLLSVAILSAAMLVFTHHYVSVKEDLLRKEYADMLSGMNKSFEEFERGYREKNRIDDQFPSLLALGPDEIEMRLDYLQRELHAVPDSFPLFSNIPRVSDVLAWLSRHEAVYAPDENGDFRTRLQIENFSYLMVKRPQQGKSKERYGVKIELELSSSTPKWAREFHDALIAPNDWVDPKAEVKWSANRGKYKTSFFLKDKTIYPGS